MASTNSISRSDLGPKGASRFDAEAFNAADLALEEKLLTGGGLPLSTLFSDIKVPVPNRSELAEDESSSYISISSVDGQDGMTFPDVVSNTTLPSRAKWRVKDGDILVSQVRPERGAVALITPDVSGSLASSGFYAVPASTCEPRLSAALYLYLRSATARRQLVRRNRNSMYPAVMGQDVESLVVPKFDDSVLDASLAIVGRVRVARKELTKKKAMLTGLFDDLLSDVGSPPSPFESSKPIDSRMIKRSDAFGAAGANRIDAEFFRSEYGDYEEAILAIPHFRLEDFFDLFAGSKVDGDDMVPVFKQSVLTNFGPNLSAVEFERAKESKGTRVIVGDILLASTAHEIAYVGKKVDQIRELPPELEENQAVAELMIIRPKAGEEAPVSTSFVVDFLRHTAGRHQVQRCIRGLRGGHTYARDIKHYVMIPKPSTSWMKDYDELSRQTDAARETCISETRKGVELMERSY